MAAKWFPITILVTLAVLAVAAAAQEKNELTGIIGRTFISDQGVQGVSTFDATLHFGKGLTFEADYGRRLRNWGLAAFTLEVPFAYNPDEDVHFILGTAPKDYSAFFVTPSLRANLLANNAISPWVSVGGGFGHFSESSTLEFGGANPGKTGTTTGVLQIGGGLDVKAWKLVSIRAQVRDFYSGVPQLNVNTGKSRQHNLFVGGGFVFHF